MRVEVCRSDRGRLPWDLLALSLIASLATTASVAQEPAAPVGGPAYTLHESYSPDAAAEATGQSRTAFVERLVFVIDNPQAAPAANEVTIRAIYQERPAEVSPQDDRLVMAAVRRYESVQLAPSLPEPPGADPLFTGLELYLEPHRGDVPPAQVTVLSPGRSLKDREFDLASKQVFVPDLAFLLPDSPVPVGESYPVHPVASAALLGGLVQDAELSGKILKVDDGPDGLPLITLELMGRAQTDRGASSIRAEVEFQSRRKDPTDAQAIALNGWITKLRLAEEIVSTSPLEGGGRIRQFLRRELTLERRPDAGPALTAPTTPPVPDVTNSWLTYDDPAGRFQLRHPQNLLRVGIPDPQSNQIELARLTEEGGDRMVLSLQPLTRLDPDQVRPTLRQEWQSARLNARELPDETGWLPEDQWPGMRIYRLAATLTPPPQGGETEAPRAINFLAYIIQTGRQEGAYVEATSSRPDPARFGREIEDIIRTLLIDRMPTASAGPARSPAALDPTATPEPESEPVSSPALVPPPG